MDAPTIPRSNSCVKNNDPVADALGALRGRGGVRVLLRALGFDSGVHRDAAFLVQRGLAARYAGTWSRDSCDAHVVRVAEFKLSLLRNAAVSAQRTEPARHQLIVIVERGGARVALGCDALGTGLRHIVLETAVPRAGDVAVLREMVPTVGESGTAHALRIMRALDRSRITDRFFRDVAAMRDAVSRGWTGLPVSATRDRDALALLLLSRLMFLYFLQRRSLLAGNPLFLLDLLQQWTRARSRGTFYHARLRTLFFGVLNTRPAQRSARAAALGELPYLNGGLFEPHAIERRRTGLDLPDYVITRIFGDLLEKYRFTSGDDESSDGVAIDPEMLGRIFEGLMPGDRRSRTGSFYTPSALVDRVVTETLSLHLSARSALPVSAVAAVLASPAEHPMRARVAVAAAGVRVLDPACGSGAFLLGALGPLARLHVADDARARVVGESLNGVDLLPDAALICSLRLWLSLIPDTERICDVRPLPNLDRRIRQGDALIDPIDIVQSESGGPLPHDVRTAIAALQPASAEYLTAGPESKTALRRRLAALELRLAVAWLASMESRLEWERRDLDARTHDRDLFGDAPAHAVSAARRVADVATRLTELRALAHETRTTRQLPFFSFRVHFPEATDGFDVILSNPPWVRSHKWPPSMGRALRQRYEVCRDAGWNHASKRTRTPVGAGGQVDLALLFLERSISLLAPGGTLGILLPAKLMRSLFGAGARALLLREMEILSIEDCSLDHRGVFKADAFMMVLIARRRERAVDMPSTTIRIARAGSATLEFSCAPADLPLAAGDTRAPWLVAPPECVRAFRVMQSAGEPIGSLDLPIRRGVMTRVNDVLLVRDFDPKLGDLARIRTEAFERTRDARYTGFVEASTIRRAVRGSDIRPWHVLTSRHVLWAPLNSSPGAETPPRLRRFLARHREALQQPAHQLGALHRISEHVHRHKVVWSDLAADLRAAPLAPRVRTRAGIELPVIPLNTVYFIPVACERDALLLAAYMNSLPFRTFARAIAERAKDAHFRFFAWVISVLPLPRDWRAGAFAEPLLDLARLGVAGNGLQEDEQNELDRLVGRAYGLDAQCMDAITGFHLWLRGT